MRFHSGVEKASECTRRAVTTLEEDGKKSVRRGRKVRVRDSIHGGKKGKEQVEEVGVIAGAEGAFTSFEFFPGERF
ncbi:MAG: hypothetical protein OIF58_07320 [Cohaesibacter sp.]|nr:hypothetical protein [Cohaesibacter sp.]